MLTTELKKIVYNKQRDKIIPFLKSLSEKDKKSLRPTLKELRGKENGNEIFCAACLVCCTPTQFASFTDIDFYGNFTLFDEVLEWYCPNWFSDILNKHGFSEWRHIPYKLVLRWQLKGYLQPSTALIANSIADSLFSDYNDKNKLTYIKPKDLNLHQLTIDEHLWTVFEVETQIGFRDGFSYSGEKGYFTKLFKILTDNKIINRMRVLKESLAIAGKGFKREPVGWFFDLFESLNPDNEELLMLQHELFQTFVCPFSRPINTSLKYLKKIADRKEFSIEDFIMQLPVLLSSDVKSIVVSTIAIVEKTNRLEPLVCESLCQAFFHKDADIQTKIALLIKKHGKPDMLKDTIACHSANLLSNTKEILKDFIGNDESIQDVSITQIADDEEISIIESVDDLVFFPLEYFQRL